MNRIILLLALVLLAAMLASCAPADFNRQADTGTIEQALSDHGLQICAQQPLAWNAVPGFSQGQFYDLGTDCTAFDPNHPKTRVWVAAFTDAASRDAALRNVASFRRLKSPAMSWTYGPLLVVADRPQHAGVAAALRQALSSIGAR